MAIYCSAHEGERVRQGRRSYHKGWGWPDSAVQDVGFELRREAQLGALTEDVVRSSEIEGEKLDNQQVRSSVARRLGMEVGGMMPVDRNIEGVVEMMLDATTRYIQPLTADRLFGWQTALFPTGRSGLQKSSQDTAYRDILDLLERGVLSKDTAGGRSTSYSLVLNPHRK